MPDPAAPPRLLLVEDDAELARLIATYLQGEGWVVEVAPDGRDLPRQLDRIQPDVLVLDWMLPGPSGHELCRAVRPVFEGRILMLTARDGTVDQIQGLEDGADDYVVKPVEPRVLHARLRALLRRAAPVAPEVLRAAGLEIHPGSRRVLAAGTAVALTDAEFDLLALLARHAGHPLSRQVIVERLRGVSYDGLDRSVDMRVVTLRQKLAPHVGSDVILTVRGTGYMLAKA